MKQKVMLLSLEDRVVDRDGPRPRDVLFRDFDTQPLICVNLDISQVTVRCRISKARKSYRDVV